jgi:hypothetical protein
MLGRLHGHVLRKAGAKLVKKNAAAKFICTFLLSVMKTMMGDKIKDWEMCAPPNLLCV